MLEPVGSVAREGHREPEGRDTAAAVGLAALLVEKEGENAAFALLPADHVIEDAKGFPAVLEVAFAASEAEDVLVTIGIKPDFPSTGYGYLCRGDELKVEEGPVMRVERFRRETRPAQSEGILEGRNLLLERRDVRLAPWRDPCRNRSSDA